MNDDNVSRRHNADAVVGFVESLRKLYDGCEIRLLTFLDT